MKETLLSIWKAVDQYVITTFILIVCFLLLVYGLGGSAQKQVQKIMNDLIKQYQIEYQAKIEEKDKVIAQKDKKIIELSNQLRVSQVNYEKFYNEVVRLKKEVASINEPKDIAEIKARLNASGIRVR